MKNIYSPKFHQTLFTHYRNVTVIRVKSIECIVAKPVMSSVCVLRPVFAFCVMLGARRMLGATENMEFNNIY